MRALAAAVGAVGLLLSLGGCEPEPVAEGAGLEGLPASARWVEVDAGTSPAPDAGTPPAPDAGLPGSTRWARGFDSSAVATPSALAVSPTGELLLASSFEAGSAELGGELFLNMGDGDAADSDLALARYSPDGGHLWSAKFGAHGGVLTPSGAAFLASGEGAVTGVASAAWTFGAAQLPAGGFIAVLGPDGAPRWARPLESAADAVAAAGQELLVSSRERTVAGDGGKAKDTLVLRRFTSDGTELWRRDFPAGGEAQISCLAVSPDGDLWIGGSYEGGLRLGDAALPALAGAPFVARLDGKGALLASRAFLAATDGVFRPAAAVLGLVATADGAFATGYFTQTLKLGLEERKVSGGGSGFVVSLDSSGKERWVRWLSADRLAMGRALALDERGGLALLATGAGALDLGAGALRTVGDQEGLFVARFHADSGALLWGQVLSNGQYLYARALQAQPSGAVVLTGMGNGELPVGPEESLHLGNQDVFLLELAP